MARSSDNRTPKKNRSEERLRATPFESVDALVAEEEAIRLAVWRRFQESKVIEEILTKTEFSHVLNELQAGLECALNNNPEDNIYKIYSTNGRGLRLEVNEKFAESLGDHQATFFQGVVQAGIEGWGAIHMQVKGLLTRPTVEGREREYMPPKKKKAAR